MVRVGLVAPRGRGEGARLEQGGAGHVDGAVGVELQRACGDLAIDQAGALLDVAGRAGHQFRVPCIGGGGLHQIQLEGALAALAVGHRHRDGEIRLGAGGVVGVIGRHAGRGAGRAVGARRHRRVHGLGGVQIGVQRQLGRGGGGAADVADIDGLQRGEVGGIHGDAAVGADRIALQIIARRVLQIARTVQGEGARSGEVARIGDAGIGVGRGDEEALTGNGQVCVGGGLLQVALLGDELAGAGQHAPGVVVALHRGIGDDVAELGVGALVADRIGVGDVVGDRRQGGGVRDQAGDAGEQGAVDAHDWIPWDWMDRAGRLRLNLVSRGCRRRWIMSPPHW